MTNSKELVVLSRFYTKIFTIFVMKLLNQVSKNLKGKLKKKLLVKTVTDIWIFLLYKNIGNFQI